MAGKTSPICSVIDLGTNTVLMLTGRHRNDGSIEILDDAHAIARLGKGIDATCRILPATIHRVGNVLGVYRDRARALGAQRLVAYGTSALRDAVNREEFIAHVGQTLDIPLHLVSGEQEAQLTFVGAGFGLQLPQRYGVIDIGGGSTELALGTAEQLEQHQSIDLGAVRLTERCFPHLPPTPAQQQTARIAVRQSLAQLFQFPAQMPLIGVAGTVTTLGAIDKGLTDFNHQALDGHWLTAERIGTLAAGLLSLSYAELRAIPQIDEQRADIISAGSLILHLALQHWQCPGVLVSTRGMRYGLLRRELGILAK